MFKKILSFLIQLLKLILRFFGWKERPKWSLQAEYRCQDKPELYINVKSLSGNPDREYVAIESINGLFPKREIGLIGRNTERTIRLSPYFLSSNNTLEVRLFGDDDSVIEEVLPVKVVLPPFISLS
jgi:hypothetical protein